MQNLIESIRAQGVLTPCMVRKKKDGRYELISGHRRKRACELLGMDALRCEIVELSKEQATILMTESNFQRSTILPSEKAFAYKMRLDAMKLLVSRMVENQKKGRNFGGEPVGPQLEKAREHLVNSYGLSEQYAEALGSADSRKHDHTTGAPVVPRGVGRARDLLAAQSTESREQIRRYVRLTELIPELLDLVDEGKIGIRPAVELSYLTEEEQYALLDCIEYNDATPSHAQAIVMKKLSQEGSLNEEKIDDILSQEKPNQIPKMKFSEERIRSVLPKNVENDKIEDFVVKAIEYYSKHLRQKDMGAR